MINHSQACFKPGLFNLLHKLEGLHNLQFNTLSNSYGKFYFQNGFQSFIQLFCLVLSLKRQQNLLYSVLVMNSRVERRISIQYGERAQVTENTLETRSCDFSVRLLPQYRGIEIIRLHWINLGADVVVWVDQGSNSEREGLSVGDV